MAAVKFFLGLLCVIVIDNTRTGIRNPLKYRVDDGSDQRIVAAARKEIGTCEGDVPNAGPKVSQYLRYAGVKTAAPWCAAWVSYVFGQAGYAEPKTAWSPALFPAKRSVAEARPGLVLGIYYPSLKRIGHCGIVERVYGDWCMSIEGNTGNGNERDGDGVWRKMRHRRSIYRFANWKGGQIKAISSQAGTQLRNAPGVCAEQLKFLEK